jgi:nucleoside 2-deoxyribosyltransferase
LKIYTAATFTEQKRIRQYKETLFNLGHSVLSTWLEEQVKPEGMDKKEFGKKMAAKDLQEIAAADCFILDLMNPSKTSGKMVETGFALAKHKLFYVVAPEGTMTDGHIFLFLADRIFTSWDELFAFFKEHHSNSNSIAAVPDPKQYLIQKLGKAAAKGKR